MYRIDRIIPFLASSALIAGCALGGDDAELTGKRADRVPVNAMTNDIWQMTPAAEGDLVGGPLDKALGLKHAVNHERAPVSVNWRYDSRHMPAGQAQRVHVASSREFQLRVGALELASGVELPISSANAIVKLNARTAAGIASLEPADISLVDQHGTVHQGMQAMDLMVSAEKLLKAGLGLTPGTSMFRVSPTLGAGPITMIWRGPGEADPMLEAVIHVREPDSAVALELQSAEPAYLAGQDIAFHARWDGDMDMARSDDLLFGTLYGPGNTEYAVELARADGEFTGHLVMPPVDHRPGHLWTLEVLAHGRSAAGARVVRTVRTAFAYAPTTARLTGQVQNHTRSDTDDLAFAFDLDVGSTGRYAVTGVLYGTDDAGAMQPISVAQSAAFLAAGPRSIEVAFDRETVAASGLTAPFEVRDLSLMDQTRLGLLHRQASALAFE